MTPRVTAPAITKRWITMPKPLLPVKFASSMTTRPAARSVSSSEGTNWPVG